MSASATATSSSQLSPLSSPGARIITLHHWTDSAWTVHEVIAEEYRILESVHYELGTPTPAAWNQAFEKRLSLWCQQWQQRFPQSPRSGASPLVYWRVALRALTTSTSQIGRSLWSPGPVAKGVPRGSSRARSSRLPSTHGVMLRWLGLVLLARASSHFSRFCV